MHDNGPRFYAGAIILAIVQALAVMRYRQRREERAREDELRKAGARPLPPDQIHTPSATIGINQYEGGAQDAAACSGPRWRRRRERTGA